MTLPSKELLSDVLETEVLGNFKFQDNVLYFECRIENLPTSRIIGVNIYELAHRCKEWAMSEGYWMYSATHENESYCYVNLNGISTPTCRHIFDTYGDTEPEAIFQASEWVRQQKGMQ